MGKRRETKNYGETQRTVRIAEKKELGAGSKEPTLRGKREGWGTLKFIVGGCNKGETQEQSQE